MDKHDTMIFKLKDQIHDLLYQNKVRLRRLAH